MKTSTLFLVIIGIISVSFFTHCGKNNSTSDIPVYSYLDPPAMPPDVFQVVFNISTYGDKETYLTFATDAVWLVEKLGDGRINFGVSNDTASMAIVKADTLGFKAGYPYRFIANNNNYDEFNNFFTQFTKLPIDYDTFEPKF